MMNKRYSAQYNIYRTTHLGYICQNVDLGLCCFVVECNCFVFFANITISVLFHHDAYDYLTITEVFMSIANEFKLLI